MMETIITILLFICYITFREYLYHKTIKDLTSKIKARDVYEYKEFEKPVKEEESLTEEIIIPPEEASPRDYLKALQKEIEVSESGK